MKSTSLPAEIFGYIVCLLAVVVFFMSTAGVVNNAFRIAHPTMRPPMMARGGMGRHHMRGGAPWMGRQAWQSQGSSMAPATGESNRFATMRDRFIADTRFNALRQFFVALVMLALSIVVFRRTFGWLNPRQVAA